MEGKGNNPLPRKKVHFLTQRLHWFYVGIQLHRHFISVLIFHRPISDRNNYVPALAHWPQEAN